MVVLFALATAYVPPTTQEAISRTLQVSGLRPFIALQEGLGSARVRRSQVDSLVSLVDSLSATLSTHIAVVDENTTLREILALKERAGPSYLPATVLRPGTPGAESMFFVDVGSNDGVRQGAPVISPAGLVGVIREVRPENAVGMDWTHPEFRASAMTSGGEIYGLVENRPGRFREDDRLVLNGVAFNEEVAPGEIVVTSGLGDMLPRGIPIGRVDALEDQEGTWRKSYWLLPVAQPGAATHVLVLRSDAGKDLSDMWPIDSIGATSRPNGSGGQPGSGEDGGPAGGGM
jgi:rod shape-determining protein MreC